MKKCEKSSIVRVIAIDTRNAYMFYMKFKRQEKKEIIFYFNLNTCIHSVHIAQTLRCLCNGNISIIRFLSFFRLFDVFIFNSYTIHSPNSYVHVQTMDYYYIFLCSVSFWVISNLFSVLLSTFKKTKI